MIHSGKKILFRIIFQAGRQLNFLFVFRLHTLTLWFFLTPICYPEASLPPAAAPLLAKNPMYVLVRAYRAIFLEGHAPAWAALWKLYALAAVVFVAGHAWFHKLRRSFADLL